MEIKTNAMRLLDKQKAVYRSYRYDSAVALSGIEVATVLGQNPKQVFKTLVTVGKSRQNYVFMIPVAEELDLKKPPRLPVKKRWKWSGQKNCWD